MYCLIMCTAKITMAQICVMFYTLCVCVCLCVMLWAMLPEIKVMMIAQVSREVSVTVTF